VPRSEPDPGEFEERPRIARVALEGVPLHLEAPLDYLIPAAEDIVAGQLVLVGLRGRAHRGLVISVESVSEIPTARLRAITRPLGPVIWVEPEELALFRWAADRFGAPLGDVLRFALPARVVDVERIATREGWLPRGRQTARPVAAASPCPDGWQPYGPAGTSLFAAAHDAGGTYLWSPMPGEDVAARLVELVQQCLAGGRDALLIVPDAKSPTATHVLAALGADVVDLRGGPGKRAVHRAWLAARTGRARVVVGERGAVFLPLQSLGLAVVLDEASPSHKERRSPRHHAREVVLERARRAGGIGLAIGSVPSAMCRGLVEAVRMTAISATPETIAARRPRILLESGELEARARLSRPAVALLRSATERGGYGVVLAARRGEGRALVCSRCSMLLRCHRCSASVARRSDGGWWCPTCGESSERSPFCARCGPTTFVPLAAGAERLGQELGRMLPVPVAVMEGYAAEAPPPPAILVMTRGSVLDRPPEAGPVLGVVLPDIDGALRRPALDAAEDALRLAFTVAGWTVRGGGIAGGPTAGAQQGEQQGPTVVIDTREPDHHALRALLAWDPGLFWTEETVLRQAFRLPPVGQVIRIDVHSRGLDLPATLAGVLPSGDRLVGPLPLAGGTAAYLLTVSDRVRTLAALRPIREDLSRQGLDVRLDVDPIDLG
jgi:primosomal protein N' (replication factor Y) (superfamily II helicase)